MSSGNCDLGELQREAEKQRTALRASEAKIATIEEKARLEREAAEKKQRDLATLEKKLKACRQNISWFEEKIAQFEGIAEGQIDLSCRGNMEGFLGLVATLTEISAWQRTVEAFKQYERSLPAKIAELGG